MTPAGIHLAHLEVPARIEAGDSECCTFCSLSSSHHCWPRALALKAGLWSSPLCQGPMVTASFLCGCFLSAPFPGTETQSPLRFPGISLQPAVWTTLWRIVAPCSGAHSQEVPVLDTYLSKEQLCSSSSSGRNSGAILHPFCSFTSALSLQQILDSTLGAHLVPEM